MSVGTGVTVCPLVFLGWVSSARSGIRSAAGARPLQAALAPRDRESVERGCGSETFIRAPHCGQ